MAGRTRIGSRYWPRSGPSPWPGFLFDTRRLNRRVPRCSHNRAPNDGDDLTPVAFWPGLFVCHILVALNEDANKIFWY